MRYRATATVITLLLVFVAGWLSATSAQSARRYITPAMAADASRLPFSGGVLVGDTLYLSGHLGVTRKSQTPDPPEAEATKVLSSVANTLRAAGMSMDDLVYVQVFCSDVSHYDAFNNAYRKMFTKELPARAFLGSGALLYGARFEVQGIAVKR